MKKRRQNEFKKDFQAEIFSNIKNLDSKNLINFKIIAFKKASIKYRE
jgi:hypothetical protein